MGPPGVGKGTQAAFLKSDLGVPHVSTGDILRQAVREGSSLGRRVKGTLDSGKLVSDELMAELIVGRLGRSDAREGFILDGFPRTKEQVAILDTVLERLGITLDGVLLLTANEEEVVRRLVNRRVCPKCLALFHLENKPPASPGICDDCGSALVQRPDDTESVILDRLRVYSGQTLPVAESYRERALLREIDAAGTPEAIARRVRQALGTS